MFAKGMFGVAWKYVRVLVAVIKESAHLVLLSFEGYDFYFPFFKKIIIIIGIIIITKIFD